MDKYRVAVHKIFNDISEQILIYNVLKSSRTEQIYLRFYLNIDMLIAQIIAFGLFFLRTIISKIMVMAQSFNVKKQLFDVEKCIRKTSNN